ncbi:uncharacterized protein BROUX77_005677 [Berkeleyomyces rouxiae]|uniref:uncharacterized protein n=1 Tax=Berkeleyomyces rouxiae TaxID=2035830 RepID=UPI003B7CD834
MLAGGSDFELARSQNPPSEPSSSLISTSSYSSFSATTSVSYPAALSTTFATYRTGASLSHGSTSSSVASTTSPSVPSISSVNSHGRSQATMALKVSYAHVKLREPHSSVATDLSVVEFTDFASTSSHPKTYLDIQEAPSQVTSQVTLSPSSTTTPELSIVTAAPEIPSDYRTVTFTQCPSDTVSASDVVGSTGPCTTLYGLVPPDFNEIPRSAQASLITTTVTGAAAGHPIITVTIPVSVGSSSSSASKTSPALSVEELSSTFAILPTTTASSSATTIGTQSTPIAVSPVSVPSTSDITAVTSTSSTLTTLSTSSTSPVTRASLSSSTELESSSHTSATVINDSNSHNNDTRDTGGGSEGNGQDGDSVNKTDPMEEPQDKSSGAASAMVNAIVWPIVAAVTLAGIGLLVTTVL